ncbi:MAG: stage III sporulation protein AF [Bacillota bacterium]|nr:stage III sporulation protein AF [Bacillota bacterium]
MEWLTEWMRNLFLTVCAVSFLQLLLPAGDMAKYLQFVFSLIVLGVILYPLLG